MVSSSEASVLRPAGASSRGPEPTVSELVERLGLGKFQFMVFVLGPLGVFFCEGALMTVLNSITVALGKELQVPTDERSVLVLFALCGVAAGTLSAGYVADTFGRRVALLLAYAVMSLGSLGLCLSRAYFALAVNAAVAGLGVGFGIAPSIAMMSETTPERYRVPARGATGASYAAGMFLMYSFIAFEDPSMKKLDWRFLIRMSSIPPFLWLFACWWLLPESPVFLASTGRRQAAEAGFEAVRRANNVADVPVTYQPGAVAAERALTFREQVGTVFSPQLLASTLAVCFASFVEAWVLFGNMYASPIVFAKSGDIPAVYNELMSVLTSMTANVVGGYLLGHMSRKSAMVIGTAVTATGCFGLVVAGEEHTPRAFLGDMLFEYAVLATPIGISLALIVIFQVAVEIYPANASAMGGSVIIGMSRVGTVVGAPLFDIVRGETGTWEAYYTLMGTMVSLAMVSLLAVPVAEGKALVPEASGLLRKVQQRRTTRSYQAV